MFGSKENELYEDFIQLSELLEAKTILINRTELNKNGKGEFKIDIDLFLHWRLDQNHSNYHFQASINGQPYKIGEYNGASAFYLLDNSEEVRVWILGASYDRISKFDAAEKSECGKESCYRKSLNEKKICKQGKLLFSI